MHPATASILQQPVLFLLCNPKYVLADYLLLNLRCCDHAAVRRGRGGSQTEETWLTGEERTRGNLIFSGLQRCTPSWIHRSNSCVVTFWDPHFSFLVSVLFRFIICPTWNARSDHYHIVGVAGCCHGAVDFPRSARVRSRWWTQGAREERICIKTRRGKPPPSRLRPPSSVVKLQCFSSFSSVASCLRKTVQATLLLRSMTGCNVI